MKTTLTTIREKISKLTQKPSKNACYFCKRKSTDMRVFKNENNQKLKYATYVLNTRKEEHIAKAEPKEFGGFLV